MTPFRNLINGAWVAGEATAPNINPSDLSDVVGEYAQGTPIPEAATKETAC